MMSINYIYCLVVGDVRDYSYLTVNTSNLNAMLNANDVSEYLKISPDGLQVSNDINAQGCSSFLFFFEKKN